MTVSIGSHRVGADAPVYVIAEIGLNHNGRRRAREASHRRRGRLRRAGGEVPEAHPRDLHPRAHARGAARDPVGEMSYLEYRYRVEFDREQYIEIGDHATMRGLDWFASPWDVPAVEFLEDLNVVAHKVASASVTDLELLRALAATGRPVILSTGMSTLEQIDDAVAVLRHRATSCCCTPPPPTPAARGGQPAHHRHPAAAATPACPVGYSGHERGLQISLAAVALGAVAVERHITLDRTMRGAPTTPPRSSSTGLEHLVPRHPHHRRGARRRGQAGLPRRTRPQAKLRRVTA